MELIINENSYMSLEEADTIVKDNFIKTDPERVYWEGIDDEDKTVLIHRTTDKVENEMLYRGILVDKKQTLKFPRIIDGVYTYCPNDIKKGLIFQLLREGVYSQSEELKLKEKGIKSFADGTGASISFDNSIESDQYKKIEGIYTDIYNNYFRNWTITI